MHYPATVFSPKPSTSQNNACSILCLLCILPSRYLQFISTLLSSSTLLFCTSPTAVHGVRLLLDSAFTCDHFIFHMIFVLSPVHPADTNPHTQTISHIYPIPLPATGTVSAVTSTYRPGRPSDPESRYLVLALF